MCLCTFSHRLRHISRHRAHEERIPAHPHREGHEAVPGPGQRQPLSGRSANRTRFNPEGTRSTRFVLRVAQIRVLASVARDIYSVRIPELVQTDWTLPRRLLQRRLQLAAAVRPPCQNRLCRRLCRRLSLRLLFRSLSLRPLCVPQSRPLRRSVRKKFVDVDFDETSPVLRWVQMLPAQAKKPIFRSQKPDKSFKNKRSGSGGVINQTPESLWILDVTRNQWAANHVAATLKYHYR